MRKRALLILALAMLIAAAGVVYAHWEETLKVDVDIATGEINPVWSVLGTDDDGELDQGLDTEPIRATEYDDGNGSSADPNEAGPLATRYTKNVALCGAGGNGTDTLTVSIIDGYPSYWCTVAADLENIGTVPVKLQGIDIVKAPEIDVHFQGAEFLECGYQLDPGDHINFYISFHPNNSATELTNYDVTLDLTWYNWNEYNPANCTGPYKYESPWNPQYYSQGGVAGFSLPGGVCPNNDVLIGGGLNMPSGTESPCPYTTVMMVPNTVYPWWTTGANEWGVGVYDVADACSNSPAYIYALCLP